MALADDFTKIQKTYKARPRANGVTLQRVLDVMAALGLPEAVGRGAFALLDDTLPSHFPRAASIHRFSDGATVAQVGFHIRMLQLGGVGKVDREHVRDEILKPLVELGAVQTISYAMGSGFVAGHVTAKSNNNAYRVEPSFLALLQTPAAGLQAAINTWAGATQVGTRLRLLGQAATTIKAATTSPHEALIQQIIRAYAPVFIPTYDVVYQDADDGNRVTQAEAAKLAQHGLALGLQDPYPDVIFAERGTKNIWIAEAVTSDGEVDLTKWNAVEAWCKKHGGRLAGATTAYEVHSYWVRRQAALHNIADGTYVWTLDDPGVQHRIQYAPAGQGLVAAAAAPATPKPKP